MALTKVNRGGLNTGIADSSDATFLTATSGEGVTLAGTLAVTGVHTVGNNAIYTSEGGAVTQNIAQGLVKTWINLNGTGTPAIRDSFNCASITDTGTGDTRVNVSSAFASVNYCTTGSGGEHADQFTGGMRAGSCYMVSTTVAGVNMLYANGGTSDCVTNCSQMTGDLA